MNSPDETLVNQIYEAAVVPSLWPDVLQRIADRAGSMGGVINIMGETVKFIPSPRIAPVFEEYAQGGWYGNEERLTQLYIEQHPCFLAETAYRTEAELDALPVYRDFLIPRGLHGACATPIQGIADTGLHIAIEGFPSHAAAEAALPFLNPLRPHIARALSLSAKVEAAKSDAMVESLAHNGVAAAVVAADATLRSANTLFADYFGNRMATKQNRVSFADGHLSTQLRALLANERTASSQSIPVRDSNRDRPFVIHVVPISGMALDIFNSNGKLLVIADGANAKIPNADLLRLLFDLTPTEAKLARALVEGTPLKNAAANLNIQESTARVHLRNIFSKTGINRQSELTATLIGLGHPKD